MLTALRSTLALAVLLGGTAASAALGQGLPAAPHAQNDPGSRASSRGDNGGALEPYLITLLLPVAGIVMAASGIVTDRRLRSAGHG